MDPSYLLNCNPDLVKERQKATFDLDKLATFFWGTWGTADRVKRRKAIAEYIEQCGDELRPTKPIAFMSREEQLETSARLCTAMLKHAGNAVDVSNPEELSYFNSCALYDIQR